LILLGLFISYGFWNKILSIVYLDVILKNKNVSYFLSKLKIKMNQD